jgi:hypothetical protein
MKLLRELITEDVKYITEETADGRKNLYISGVFLQSEIENKNHRVYPKHLLQREVARYVKESVDKGNAWGELGHPDTPSINLDRVSHRIVSLKEDGNNFVGKAIITTEGNGKIVKGLIECGGQLGVSSRGMGSLKPMKEAQMVQDDYYLATAGDIVADPSAPDALVQGIMENREWVWHNGIIKEAEVARMKSDIMGASRKQLEEVTLRNFENFLKRL